ncbi:hypothetical protein [Mucilaginibacter sp. SP1R1]|uniref:hypothetical protein n=1 Tax=Mucilaginibacter sp. SP1R1 TaxID=2723091 RepID=UPI001620F219|nr:hypothetical protein [Mucilaginibacter sp. SP1R1]MBB6152397.1 hypothetical protein [Mucilaginibacter sp. SP1R1]
MKNSRSIFIALAFVLGIGGALAGKAAQAAPKPAAVWWNYNGDQTPAQLSDPSKYSFSASDPGCPGLTDRCAVQASRSTGNPNQPNLSTITQEEFQH